MLSFCFFVAIIVNKKTKSIKRQNIGHASITSTIIIGLLAPQSRVIKAISQVET